MAFKANNLQNSWIILLLSLLNYSPEIYSLNNALQVKLQNRPPTPTLVDITESITNAATATQLNLKPAITNQFICTTWIFPLSSLQNSVEISQEFSTANQFTVKFPRLIISHQQLVPNKEEYARNFSYKGYEFSYEDIIKPVKYGVQRYGINCASIFIDLRNTTEEAHVETWIRHLYAMKLARQHKDYFIFIRDTASVSHNSMDFLNSDLITEQRYKYIISVDKEHSMLHVINTCALPSENNIPLYSRKCNPVLNGQYLRASCGATQAIIRPDSTSTLKPLTGGGYIYYMFQETAKQFNFTFNAILASLNGATGLKKEINGKLVWIGAVGEVFSNEADITFGAGLTLDRNHVIDTTVLYEGYGRVFYIKAPDIRSSWLSILWPLDIYVWITTVIIGGLLLTPIYYAAAIVHFFKFTTTRRRNRNNNKQNIYKHYWKLLIQVMDSIFRIFIEQSATTATVRSWTSITLRFLLILWAITCLILETAYRCKLVVFLSFAIKEDYPKTHSELASYATLSNLQQANYKLYFRFYGGAAYNAYKRSTNPIHSTILKNSYLVNSSVDCLEAVLNSNTAITNSQPVACLDFDMSSEYTILKNFTLPNSGPSDVNSGTGTGTSISQLFIRSTDVNFKFFPGWNLRKGSRWTETFDRILLSYFAYGFYDFWVKKDWMITRKGGIEYWKQLEQVKQKQHNGNSTISNQQQLEHDQHKYKTIQKWMENSMNKGPKSINKQNLKGLFLICGIGLSLGIVSFLIEFLSRIRYRN